MGLVDEVHQIMREAVGEHPFGLEMLTSGRIDRERLRNLDPMEQLATMQDFFLSYAGGIDKALGRVAEVVESHVGEMGS